MQRGVFHKAAALRGGESNRVDQLDDPVICNAPRFPREQLPAPDDGFFEAQIGGCWQFVQIRQAPRTWICALQQEAATVLGPNPDDGALA